MSFMKATPEQRKELLVALDKERGEYQKTKKKEDPNHYFQYFQTTDHHGLLYF